MSRLQSVTQNGCDLRRGPDMEDAIPITCLNDFVFCPASIYFHRFYDGFERIAYHDTFQINGSHAHKAIDNNTYSTSDDVIASLTVFSEEYQVIGKIDLLYQKTGVLVERKKVIKEVYDGYVFQLYAQYFALKEMGYQVNKIQLYSMDDNRKYDVTLPEKDPVMQDKFRSTLNALLTFDLEGFQQVNEAKCNRCIYEPACDRTLKDRK